MAGTRLGGLRAAEKNKAGDPSYYVRIGALGGRKSRTGGFFANRVLASLAGRKGGSISRRRKFPQPA